MVGECNAAEPCHQRCDLRNLFCALLRIGRNTSGRPAVIIGIQITARGTGALCTYIIRTGIITVIISIRIITALSIQCIHTVDGCICRGEGCIGISDESFCIFLCEIRKILR